MLSPYTNTRKKILEIILYSKIRIRRFRWRKNYKP